MPKKPKEVPPTWAQRKAGIKRAWTTPFQRIEWACEWFAYRMSQWAFIEVLEYGGKLAIVVTAFVYFLSYGERKQAAQDARKAKHYIAWQTLNSAYGKPGNAGRLDALQDLNRDGVSLDGIDLSGGVVFTQPACLTNSRMGKANLANSVFYEANFNRAQLRLANMSGAEFENCQFRGAIMTGAIFKNTILTRCDFSSLPPQANYVYKTHAELTNGITDLRLAKLLPRFETDKNGFAVPYSFVAINCSFVAVSFGDSEWDHTHFIRCNFAFADLRRLKGNWTNSEFADCNFFGVGTNMAPPGFMNWATNNGCVSVPITNHSEWLVWLEKDTPKPKLPNSR